MLTDPNSVAPALIAIVIESKAETLKTERLKAEVRAESRQKEIGVKSKLLTFEQRNFALGSANNSHR